MTALDDDRAVLAGLRFARDSMTAQERRTLCLAEAMLRRIDAALEICDPTRSVVYTDDVRVALGAVPAATQTR